MAESSKLTFKDWIQIVVLAGATIGGYMMVDFRLSKIEARMNNYESNYIPRTEINLMRDEAVTTHNALSRRIDRLESSIYGYRDHEK